MIALKGILSAEVAVLLLCCIPSSGQPLENVQQGFRLARLLYENTLGEKGVTDFTPDPDGRIVKGFWELANKSRSSVNTYQYDHKGLLVSAFREFSDSLTSLEVYTYDEHGRRTAEHFTRSDNVRGEASYYYDSDGKRLRARYTHHKGWLDGDVVYSYDARGLLRSAVMLNDADTVAHIGYEYDTTGNLTHETWEFSQGWNQSFTYEYDHIACTVWAMPNPFITNSCEFRVAREEYSFNGTLGGPSIYEYAREGSLCRKTFSRSDGWSSVTTFTYDPEYRLVQSLRKTSDNAETVFTYAYDRMHRLILRTQWNAGAIASTESYLYTVQGTLEKAVYENVDGWLTGVLTFAYDARGRIAGGVFRGGDGSSADVSFVYDAPGCLREVRWRFSSGKEQVYRYTYEERRGSAGRQRL
jgi:hypothetical protein